MSAHWQLPRRRAHRSAGAPCERCPTLHSLAHTFLRAAQKTQKCLQLDVAVGMWQLLFAGERRWPYIDDWCEFLQQHHNRAISKDTWVQLFEFVRSVKPDFSNFDESAAWPYL